MTKGERLKSMRENKGLTQTELAKLINSTKQTIYKYENDIITNIPYDKIVGLAKAFNVEPAYIMGWEEESNIASAMLQTMTDRYITEINNDMSKMNDEMKQKLLSYSKFLLQGEYD